MLDLKNMRYVLCSLCKLTRYEIILDDEQSQVTDSLPRSAQQPSSSSMDSSGGDAERVKPKVNKALALLDALEAREEWTHREDIPTSNAQIVHYPPDTLGIPGQIGQIIDRDILMRTQTINSHSTVILQHLNRLDMLDGRVNGLSRAINYEYYRLGASYNGFIEVSLTFQLLAERTSQSKRETHGNERMHSRTEQNMAFECLREEPELRSVMMNMSARTALKKRLQRARKFEILVRILGESIMGAMPEVCVSRVDQIRMVDLEAFLTHSMEARIKRILQKQLPRLNV